jgi:hypothetical protein
MTHDTYLDIQNLNMVVSLMFMGQGCIVQSHRGSSESLRGGRFLHPSDVALGRFGERWGGGFFNQFKEF